MAGKRKRTKQKHRARGQPPEKKPKTGLVQVVTHRHPRARSESSQARAPTGNPSRIRVPKSISFREAPTLDERRAEAQVYDLLGSEDTAVRLAAAEAVVHGLVDGDGVPELVLQRHIGNRLIRGLASGRNASRLGFSLALTELLWQLFGERDLAATTYPGLDFDKTLLLLLEKTKPEGNVPGQEERDHYLGRLFGLECFVKAKVLPRDRSRWEGVLDELIKLASTKTWLRQQCGWVVCQALSQMDTSQAKGTLKRYAAAGLAKSPEGVGLWLTFIRLFPDAKPPSEPWKDPLSRKRLRDLPGILKGSTDAERGDDEGEGAYAGKTRKVASWTPQLHWVWDTIFTRFAQPQNRKEGRDTGTNVASFGEFWGVVVDDGYFGDAATDTQKFTGFLVFQRALEIGSTHRFIFDNVFSPRLIRCLANQSSQTYRYLHGAAVRSLGHLDALLETLPDLVPLVLENLLLQSGAYNFDARSKTRTVASALEHATMETTPAILEILKAPLITPPSDVEELASMQVTFSDHLAKLLKATGSLSPDDSQTIESVISSVLTELTTLAYSDTVAKPSDKEQIRARVASSLTLLMNQAAHIPTICNVIAKIKPAISLDEEIQASIDGGRSRLKKLQKKLRAGGETSSGLIHGLALLHAIALIQLYNEESDAVDMLQDLEKCYEGLDWKGEGKKDDDEGAAEFLVEIFLSLLSKPSAALRQTARHAFESVTGVMTASSLKLLMDPLSAPESVEGERELFHTADEEESVDDSGDDSELDSDVELIEPASESDGSDEEDHQGPDSGDSESEADDSKAEELQALDNALGELLRTKRPDNPEAAGEADSDSDSDMSDSEMLALDDKLSQAFLAHSSIQQSRARREGAGARVRVVAFKSRVLDLADAYLRRETASPLALGLLSALVRLVATTADRPLGKRAMGIVARFAKASRRRTSRAAVDGQAVGEAGGTDAGQQWQEERIAAVAEMHDMLQRNDWHVLAQAVSTASLVLATSLGGDEAALQRVREVYVGTKRGSWGSADNKMQREFFGEWRNWCLHPPKGLELGEKWIV